MGVTIFFYDAPSVMSVTYGKWGLLLDWIWRMVERHCGKGELQILNIFPSHNAFLPLCKITHAVFAIWSGYRYGSRNVFPIFYRYGTELCRRDDVTYQYEGLYIFKFLKLTFTVVAEQLRCHTWNSECMSTSPRLSHVGPHFFFLQLISSFNARIVLFFSWVLKVL